MLFCMYVYPNHGHRKYHICGLEQPPGARMLYRNLNPVYDQHHAVFSFVVLNRDRKKQGR